MQVKTPNNLEQIQKIKTENMACKMFIKSTLLYTHQVYWLCYKKKSQ